MEKIDLLIWDDRATTAAPALDVPGLRSVQMSAAADLPRAPLLLGKGPALRGVAEIWVDSVDVWPEIVAQIPGDAYLVTESVPQPVAAGGVADPLHLVPQARTGYPRRSSSTAGT